MQMLCGELKKWGLEAWYWQVKQLSEADFGVVFPSKKSLRMMATCSSFTLPLNKVVVSIKAAAEGGKTLMVLSDLWVLLDDVPP